MKRRTALGLVSIVLAWLAMPTAAFAQDQLSIRCMTREPDEDQRGRIDDEVRRNRELREALGIEPAVVSVSGVPQVRTLGSIGSTRPLNTTRRPSFLNSPGRRSGAYRVPRSPSGTIAYHPFFAFTS